MLYQKLINDIARIVKYEINEAFDFNKLGKVNVDVNKVLSDPHIQCQYLNIENVLFNQLGVSKLRGFKLSQYENFPALVTKSSYGKFSDDFIKILQEHNYKHINCFYNNKAFDIILHNKDIEKVALTIPYIQDLIKNNERYDKLLQYEKDKLSKTIVEIQDFMKNMPYDIKNFIYNNYNNIISVYISPDKGLIYICYNSYVGKYSQKGIFTFTGEVTYNDKINDYSKVNDDIFNTKILNKKYAFINKQLKISNYSQNSYIGTIKELDDNGYPVYRLYFDWPSQMRKVGKKYVQYFYWMMTRSHQRANWYENLNINKDNYDIIPDYEFLSKSGMLYYRVYNQETDKKLKQFIKKKYLETTTFPEKKFYTLNFVFHRGADIEYNDNTALLGSMVEVGLTDTAKKELDKIIKEMR